MSRKHLPIAAAALILAASSFGLVSPTAEAVTAIGGNAASITPASNPNLQLAYVKKKVVIKKKTGNRTVKKTVTTYSRPGYRYHYGDRGYSFGFSAYPQSYSNCRSVVKYVKYRHQHKSVRTVRRVCS